VSWQKLHSVERANAVREAEVAMTDNTVGIRVAGKKYHNEQNGLLAIKSRGNYNGDFVNKYKIIFVP